MSGRDNRRDLDNFRKSLKGFHAKRNNPDYKERHLADKKITFEDIIADKQIRNHIKYQDWGLQRIGKLINLHDESHSQRVMDIGYSVLIGTGHEAKDELVQDFKIAAILHDIGNGVGRGDHAHSGSKIAEKELLRVGAKVCGVGVKKIAKLYNLYMTKEEEQLKPAEKASIKKCEKLFTQIRTICYAIKVHSETEKPLNLDELPKGYERNGVIIAAALFLGDKGDISELRVRSNGVRDTHMKVNDCVSQSNIQVRNDAIVLNIITDDEKLLGHYREIDKKAAEKEFIHDILKTDKCKFVRCNGLSKTIFKRNFKVYINGKMLNIPEFFENMKVVTSNSKCKRHKALLEEM